MLSRLFGIKSNSSEILTDSVGLVYVDAENCKTTPQDLMFSITNHHGSKPTETFAYSKWSAKGQHTKKYREAGFRLLQADSGDNNADIMMSLDAYQRVRDLASMGVQGNVYICFHGDRGFTHLLEKLRAISGWRSIWVTSNNIPNKMIGNSASETLRITPSQNDTAKNALVDSNSADKKGISENIRKKTDNFKEIIIQVIGKEEIRSSTFGQKIIKYQKENGWNETGKKAFNIRFGLPIGQTYKATISNELSPDIEILFPESNYPIYKRASTTKNLSKSSFEKYASNNSSVELERDDNDEIITFLKERISKKINNPEYFVTSYKELYDIGNSIKKKFEITWAELFKSFELSSKGTIPFKMALIYSQLGFSVEEQTTENRTIGYKITLHKDVLSKINSSHSINS